MKELIAVAVFTVVALAVICGPFSRWIIRMIFPTKLPTRKKVAVTASTNAPQQIFRPTPRFSVTGGLQPPGEIQEGQFTVEPHHQPRPRGFGRLGHRD